MKRISVLFVCWLAASGLWAQSSVALKQLPKATKAAVNIQEIENACTNLSQIAYFHRWGNMEFWYDAFEIKPAFTSSKVITSQPFLPRKSILRQLSALQIMPQNPESWTRQDLEELLITYTVFSNAENYDQETPGEFLTREDSMIPVLMSKNTDSNQKLNQWALTQPDFYLTNYRPRDYQQPFHPGVKSLRILLVSNDDNIINLVLSGRTLHNNIQIDFEDNINSGISFLEEPGAKYDVIVTDFAVPGGERNRGGYEMGMYAWNKKLNIPVIILSKEPLIPTHLILHNIVGQSFYLNGPVDVNRFFNYLSNIVATGKAYPTE